MTIKYQTGIATLIQFIALSLLNFLNGIVSVATTCHSDSSNCISNLLVSLIFLILIVVWFGFIWVLGLAAQDRRSRRLSQTLIAAEFAIGLVAAYNARHHTDWLSLITSLVDLVLAIWVITLAFRLMRSHGARIVTHHHTDHPRQRHHETHLN